MFLKAESKLVLIDDIAELDIEHVEDGFVTITTFDNKTYECKGFDAIEAVMALKPSALEGKRFKWERGAWAFHNMIGHPGTQILSWLGFKKTAIKFHDWTVPHPRDFKKTVTQNT